MNIITKQTPNGSERSCTARCYNSTHKKCTCVCKRLLHGKGKAYAKLMAGKAAMYLQLQHCGKAKYFVATELLADMQGR